MDNGEKKPEQQKKRGRDRLAVLRSRPGIVLLILFLLLVALYIYSVPKGHYTMSFSEAYGILFKKLAGLIPNWWDSSDHVVFLDQLSREEVASKMLLRTYLPRTAGAVLVGASLAAAGAVYQGIFRNPLVSPDLLGASAGAAFGGALSIFLYWGGTKSLMAAFLCGLIAVTVVYLISLVSRGEQTLTLLLGGVMISSLFHAGITVLKFLAPDDNALPSLTFWLMGAVSNGFRSEQLRYIVAPVAIGLLILFLLRWKINLLTVGEEEAKSMGTNPVWVRAVAILAATLVTAATVAVCGTIGWIGLVVPHLMRKLVGPDFRVLLPASMIAGGMVLLLLDNIALMGNPTTPLGVLTGFVGVPFYLILLMDRRRQL